MGKQYVLKLYINGYTKRAKKLIDDLKEILNDQLKDEYELEIINIDEDIEKAEEANILATPTLLRKLPLPVRKIVGCLADEEKILVGLGID